MEYYTFEEPTTTAFERKQYQPMKPLYRPRRVDYESESESESEYENENLFKQQQKHCPIMSEDEEKELYREQPFYFYENKFFSKKQPFYFYENKFFSKKQPFEREQEQRKWYRTIEVTNLRPEEIKVVVDPINYTLTIFPMRRVLRLPRNLNLEEMRVKYTPNGELLVKAPYQTRDYDAETMTRRGKFTIPVDFTKPVRGQLREQFYQPRCEYFHLVKKTTNTTPKYVETECVRDETTGEYKVVFYVNTVGFRREEIKLQFQEKERLLLVKAKHQLRREEFEQLKGIVPKTLIREFILPEWLEVEEMRYTVTKNGVLRIEVPCQAEHYPKKQQLIKNFYYKYF